MDRAKGGVVLSLVFGAAATALAADLIVAGGATAASLLTLIGGGIIIGTSLWAIRHERYSGFARYREQRTLFWLVALATLAFVVGIGLQIG
ncbi:MAG: hypothetical protein J07HN6_00781 [Halonotius sp. J07HN6]|nr:MAG: hypothetical protein J07HN6_00781 [Halonotius sp. J07HN6]